MGKDILIFFATLMLLCGFSYYSYNGYEVAQGLSVENIGIDLEKEQTVSPLLRADLIEGMSKDIDTRAFGTLDKRNPFVRYKPVVKQVAQKPIALELPKPKIVPVPVEPAPEVIPDEVYFFRGQVSLGQKISYAIERERDKKTFFVNKGDQTRDFIVLDTNEKQVIITDYNENIKVLKKAN
jgi:hypothetical protein